MAVASRNMSVSATAGKDGRVDDWMDNNINRLALINGLNTGIEKTNFSNKK